MVAAVTSRPWLVQMFDVALPRRYDGLIHGFFGLSGAFDASRDAIELVGTALRRAFGTLDA